MKTTRKSMTELDITEDDLQESKHATNIKKKINDKFLTETKKWIPEEGLEFMYYL